MLIRPSPAPGWGRGSAKLFLLLGVLALFGPPSPAWSGEWRSQDPDTSPAHLPAKILSDLSGLFSPQSLPPLFIGAIGSAFDWGAYDRENGLAARLAGWKARPLFDAGNFYGEGWVEGGTALGSWAFGAATGDLRLQQFGRDAAESLILSTALVTGLKLAVDRTRPDGGAYSFPSGHSITAFCFAPVVQKYGGWELGIPAYSLAAVTAFARVEGYHHYLSDVIAGAALGIIVGNASVYAPKDLSLSAGPGELAVRWSFD